MPKSSRDVAWAAGLGIAFVLGAWLRLHGLGGQVVQDDEWHAINKLMTSGYGEIFRSFGGPDHSIPLTLLYKAMAATLGLTEINMRILQALAGIALIPVAAAITWAASRSRAATLLCAFLVAGAPFLVLYSRTARPYAITTLFVEVPKDARFRFRNFVFLDDRDAVLATGARYLLLRLDQFHGRPFRQADRCLAALTRPYGELVDLDSRLAVFDLHPAGASRKLQ